MVTISMNPIDAPRRLFIHGGLGNQYSRPSNRHKSPTFARVDRKWVVLGISPLLGAVTPGVITTAYRIEISPVFSNAQGNGKSTPSRYQAFESPINHQICRLITHVREHKLSTGAPTSSRALDHFAPEQHDSRRHHLGDHHNLGRVRRRLQALGCSRVSHRILSPSTVIHVYQDQ